MKAAMKLEISRNCGMAYTAVKSVAFQDGFLSVELSKHVQLLTFCILFLTVWEIFITHLGIMLYVIWATCLCVSLQ